MTGILRPAFERISRAYGAFSRLAHPYAVLPPLRITLMFTTRCNQRCDFCYVRDDLNKPEPDRLSLDEWEKIADSIPHITALSITGGEPFLAPDIYPVLDRLLSRKHWISVVTNGTTLNRSQVEFLVDRRLFFLMVSVHGTPRYYAARGHDRAFERISETLRFLSAYKRRKESRYPLVGMKTCITEDNAEEIPRLLELAEGLPGLDHIQFNLMFSNPLQNGFRIVKDLSDPLFKEGNSFTYSPEKKESVKRAVRHVLEKRKSSEIPIGFTLRTFDYGELCSYIDSPSLFGVKSCNMPWNEFSLYYNGRVTPCLTYDIGDIRDMGYDVRRVLSQPRYRAFLDFFEKQMPFVPPCEGCHLTRQSRKR